MKTIRVHPASKLRQKFFTESVTADSQDNRQIFVGNHFWRTVLHPDFLRHFSAESGSESIRVQEIATDLRIAGEIFSTAGEVFLSNEDLAFCFWTFSWALEKVREAQSDWEIHPWSWPLHVSGGFDENKVDFSMETVDSVIADPFFQKTVSGAYDWNSIRNSIIVFDFFWASELLQIFALSKKLKELGNIVIIDASSANEQGDHAQWIRVFEKNAEAFGYFDYFVAYQDYGISLGKLIEALRSGSSPAGIPNVLLRKNDGSVSFSKPKAGDVAPDDLFSAFSKYSFEGNEGGEFFGERVATARMVPFKCHWSGCHFCTINSTHVFPYDSDRGTVLRYVDRLIRFLKEKNIVTFIFQDEALRPEDLRLFADRVRESGIPNFHYRFRTRFSKEYTRDFCQYLADTGATFAGIGLECASDRVDALINKGSWLTLAEKEEVISNFESAGIAFHAYSIFGLPTETLPEMRDTFVFLKDRLENGRNFGCTPNTFWLNRGSEMYRHPEKFGLSPHASDEGKVLDIRIGRKMDDAYLKIQQRFISELLRIEFLPFMPEGSPIPSGYWKFLDYGHAYYPMRGNALRKNLFRKRWNASRTLLALESHQILDRMFAVSPYLRIHEIFGGFKIRDGGTFSEIEASSEETKFIRGFQSGKKLSENLLSHPLSAPFETVRKFIAAGILYETP